MLLLVDNYDSFTYNLCDYFGQLKEEVRVVKNDEYGITEIENMEFSRLVISPGPGKPEEKPLLNELLNTFCGRKPILGICLGHQAIGRFFGAGLYKASKPMHGKLSSLRHTQNGIYQDIGQNTRICRYHSLVLGSIEKSPLVVTGIAEDTGEIMSVSHPELAVEGIQFHPEAHLTQNGLKMLGNWLELTRN
jgi:anthranilate synthase/aminodeoxychorismate synthase-like glutamine amidotransferase